MDQDDFGVEGGEVDVFFCMGALVSKRGCTLSLMKTVICILAPLLLFAPVLGAAEPLDLSVLTNRMGADGFRERESATQKLLEISRTKLPEVAVALFAVEKSDDPEIRLRARETLKRLFEFHVLGDGDVSLGVQWNWHLQVPVEGEMRARPIVEEIDEDSPAKAAGLKKGDVVCYVNKRELPRQDGLPELRRILREAKPGTTLVLRVRSCKFLEGKETSSLKPPRDVSIPVAGLSQKTREPEKEEYANWLSDLRARHQK